MALSLLSSYSPIEEKEEILPALYVTQSKGLVREMAKLWQELQDLKGFPDAKEVHLRSYEDLCKELLVDLGEKTSVGQERFTQWYAQYLKKAKVRQKQEKTLHIPDFDAEKIYQEFRICSGYKKAPYLELGDRQSLITKITKK